MSQSFWAALKRACGVLPITITGKTRCVIPCSSTPERIFWSTAWGEKPAVQIADLLQRGVPIKRIHDLPGTVYAAQQAPEGAVEVRGEFWDVGRLSPDDPHTGAYGLPALVQARMGDRWPAQGELLVVNVSSVAAAQPSVAEPSVTGRRKGEK
jgi:hypothetical protein